MQAKAVIGEQQDGTLQRRVVSLIKERPDPEAIFKLITSRKVLYSPQNRERLGCRDTAFMGFAFTDAGRVSELTGGPAFTWDKKSKRARLVKGKRHLGVLVENLDVNEDRILVRNAPVVKRSWKVIEKYGIGSTIRDPFAIPLKIGLFENPFWDQFVPFGWLLKEYLERFAPEKGKLFGIEDTRGYQIIREVTGNYPNWFRSQAENFYGHYIFPDTVKLSKFVNIQDPKHVKHYIGYDWTEQLKDRSLSMNFDWIEPAIRTIQERCLV